MGPSIINFTIHSSTTMYRSTATEIQCCIPTVLWVLKPKVSFLIHGCHCCDFEDEYNHTAPGGGWPRVQNEVLMAVLLLFSFSFLLFFTVCSLCIRKFLSYKLQCPVCNMVSIDCWLSTAQCYIEMYQVDHEMGFAHSAFLSPCSKWLNRIWGTTAYWMTWSRAFRPQGNMRSNIKTVSVLAAQINIGKVSHRCSVRYARSAAACIQHTNGGPCFVLSRWTPTQTLNLSSGGDCSFCCFCSGCCLQLFSVDAGVNLEPGRTA